MRERIVAFLCDHSSADDRGVVRLWNGEEKMLKQCSCCGALFVKGYGVFEPLPGMFEATKLPNEFKATKK